MKKLLTIMLLGVVVNANANELYNSSCVGCHGVNGEGGVGKVLQELDKEYIEIALHKYKANIKRGEMSFMMFPVASNLSDEDIDKLSTYISETFK